MKHYRTLFPEAIHRDVVVRGGKRMIKFDTDKVGFKVDMSGESPHEVKMTPQEIRHRVKGARLGAKKAKKHSRQANIKRQRSMAKR